MVMSYKAGPELGIIEVHTTNEGGHPVDFWAKRCIERIIAVSEDAPEEVQKQITDFKDYIEKVIIGKKGMDFVERFKRDLNTGIITPFGEAYTGKEQYKKEILSNWIYELQDAGMLPRSKDGSVNTITANDIIKGIKFYENNPMFKNIIKWTQYRKILENGTEMSFDTSKYGKEGIKTIVIKDSEGAFGISDGEKFYSKRLRKDVLEEAGRDLQDGYIKDVVVTDPVYNPNLSI